ncbi:phosphonate metabolism protein/1,5-bisphosphokinase (PRPP-forming) PhnN [Oricola cellulosilytica]|uniref:phosphonate metabolism protein/1,5-bisphosphokinase (PRPP-forming) PhnN n=1 Tax=Oricola cellulosilytica TaxID=1429082 RepID=UPI001304C75E|nr:phosphonate metabolism protein/1,5-bisphosphokinase (PRPP-forming) PhnN [Oricola cellulosilytica]
MSPEGEAEQPGVLVAVVGPSGAGKDSLLRYASERLEGDDRFLFVRRIVTRPADPASEDHVSVSEEAFVEAETEGRFAVAWRAHGHSYALSSEVLEYVEAGGIAVANCSRAALGRVRDRFRVLEIITVTARPQIIAARIASRGREDAAATARRVDRRIDDFPGRGDAIEIDNSGALETAGEEFTAVLLRLARR